MHDGVTVPENDLDKKNSFDLKDINLTPDSSFEELISEAYKLSELKNKSNISDKEIEKETCYQLAESGMLNLIKTEIDLIFLKRNRPVPPPCRVIKHGSFTIIKQDSSNEDDLIMLGFCGTIGFILFLIVICSKF